MDFMYLLIFMLPDFLIKYFEIDSEAKSLGFCAFWIYQNSQQTALFGWLWICNVLETIGTRGVLFFYKRCVFKEIEKRRV